MGINQHKSRIRIIETQIAIENTHHLDSRDNSQVIDDRGKDGPTFRLQRIVNHPGRADRASELVNKEEHVI
jgi:hypothetical protein